MKLNRGAFIILVFFIAITISACSTTSTRKWSSQIQESTVNYTTTMTCVTPIYRVSPWQCTAPQPSGARLSQAHPSSPHGRKLYHLYVSDPIAYTLAADGVRDAPVGLTLVKEAHYTLGKNSQSESTASNLLEEDPKFPGPIAELFIMSKVGTADTPETDQGWIYSVADPDGVVSFSGLIQSCMNCHQKSTHDRLFGLPPATTIYKTDSPLWDSAQP